MIEDIEYPVEKILRRRVTRKNIQYLVKWEGYDNKENSWVNEQDMQCDELLEQFRAHRIIGNQFYKFYHLEIFPDYFSNYYYVIAAKRTNNQLFYLMKLKFGGLSSILSSIDVRGKFPFLLIDFLESNLMFVRNFNDSINGNPEYQHDQNVVGDPLKIECMCLNLIQLTFNEMLSSYGFLIFQM